MIAVRRTDQFRRSYFASRRRPWFIDNYATDICCDDSFHLVLVMSERKILFNVFAQFIVVCFLLNTDMKRAHERVHFFS